MSSKLSSVYKQRKQSLKSPSKGRKKARNITPAVQQENALNEENDDVEDILKNFDMDISYGPCIGVSRMERWLRAEKHGLKPPAHVKDLLERVAGAPDCLWEGRV